MIESFRGLEVWRLGLELAEAVYRCASAFPKSELFGLSFQMRKAAVSVSSNIAERRGGTSTKEFLHIALGSLGELETQFELATRLGYVGAGMHPIVTRADVLGKKLRCLQQSPRARLRPLVPSP